MSKHKPSLGTNLEQKQIQTLTPLQIKFVRLLEMTPLQLEEEIQKDVFANPALEVVDKPSSPDFPSEGDPFMEPKQGTGETDYLDYEDGDDRATTAEPSLWEWDGATDYGNQISSRIDRADMDQTLADYLNQQLSELKLSDEVMAVAEYIVGNIDDNGYMTRTLNQIYDDITINKGLDIPFSWFKEAYDVVRGLDPAGVGASNLQDCLLLQLNRKDQKKEDIRLATTIVKDYFEMFSQMHFNELCLALKIDRETLKKVVDRIKSLNPKPGAQIGYSTAGDLSSRIVPEFIVEVDGDKITVNLAYQPPELAISPAFVLKAIADNSPAYKKDEYVFIKKHNEEAAEMIHLMEMRRTTLLKVISAIVELQRPFFLSDDQTKIRPMVLKDIAKLTNLDLSVISRATKDKYLQTNSGVYPLKLFFSEAPTSSSEEEQSIYAYFEALKNLIDNEDKHSPLSDEALQKLLAEQGFDISRRTVTKYRDKLGYPVARYRKGI